MTDRHFRSADAATGKSVGHATLRRVPETDWDHDSEIVPVLAGMSYIIT